MRRCLQVTIFGPDHHGVTAHFMQLFTHRGVELVDLAQDIAHGFLSLSMVFHTSEESAVLDELKLKAQEFKMSLSSREFQQEKKLLPQFEKYILSCVSVRFITAAFVGEVSSLFSAHGIHIVRMKNLSNERSGEGFKSLDIALTSAKPVDVMKIKSELMKISQLHRIDAVFMRDNIFRFNKRLIVFDMDSTLIQAEVIDEMAASFGVGDKVKEITERAMNGELNFDEALRERVLLLKGMPKKNMDEIMNHLPLTPGVERFIQTVRGLGLKTAIVSGGFRYFAENLRAKLGIDYAFANELDWDGEKLSGKVRGQIVNADQKAFILELLAQQERIDLEQVVAVGDGANDLPMLAKAGLGIAFHAKEKVKLKARHQMEHGPMTTILYFLGIQGDHFNETF
jgi:phosphoserine phosphatase